MKMCQGFANQGNRVSLITRGVKNHKINDYDYYGVKANFRIIKFNIKDIRIISSILFSTFAIIKIMTLKPDLIYTRHRFILVFLKLFNIHLIFEDHSPPVGIYKYIINRAINRSNTNIVLISNALKKLYKRNLPNIERIKFIVAHDGADPIPTGQLSTPILNLDKSKCNCGYIGHLYKGRGINIILQIAKQMPNNLFHVIGGDAKDIDYWRLKNHNNNVLFYGYIKPNKIPYLLGEFDILLAPYQKQVYLRNGLNTGSWMSPLKIFEYMSSGVPIICSKIKVLEEVLINGMNAIMVPHNSIGHWVDAIKKLTMNDKLRKKIAQRALRDFMENYTWENRVKYILKNYN